MNDFYAKMFDELSSSELYEILKSRAEIFLLEQKIICQDMDDVDYRSLHCFMKDRNRVTAYLRAFQAEDGVMIGRVLTLAHGNGTGRELMKKSLAAISEKFRYNRISLHAQTQASGFYEKMGFRIVSDVFEEEGVPHVTMEMVK